MLQLALGHALVHVIDDDSRRGPQERRLELLLAGCIGSDSSLEDGLQDVALQQNWHARGGRRHHDVGLGDRLGGGLDRDDI